MFIVANYFFNVIVPNTIVIVHTLLKRLWVHFIDAKVHILNYKNKTQCYWVSKVHWIHKNHSHTQSPLETFWKKNLKRVLCCWNLLKQVCPVWILNSLLLLILCLWEERRSLQRFLQMFVRKIVTPSVFGRSISSFVP